MVGCSRPVLATVHSSVADGHVTHPFLLQISISPLSLTDQAQRAPLAVLSMHMPTAVLPSVAKAGVDVNVTAMAVKIPNAIIVVQVFV